MKTPDFSHFRNDLTAIRGSMLANRFLAVYKEIDRKRARRLRTVKTRADAEKYIEEVKSKLRLSFGPVPPVRVIGPRVTGQVETGKLLIEKILFQSRPGWYVSALFYRPKTYSGKLPGVLFLCGHNTDGKFARTYQRVPQSLALRGFGVLIPDPYGQGERQEGELGCTIAHNAFGYRLGLLGEFLGTWRVHDALTALEYLKSRPEINSKKLCVTGCSGGGTLTSYVAAFASDPLIAAPVCSMTRMTCNLEREICGDCEQEPPRFRALELDENDLLIAAAPRPILYGVQDNDFFSVEGTRAMCREMKKFYTVFGREDQVRYCLGKGDHGYSETHQRAIGKFFAEMTEAKAAGTDKEIRIFPPEELFCTPRGSVWKLPGARDARAMLREIYRRNRQPEAARTCWQRFLPGKEMPVPPFSMGFQQYIEPTEMHGSRYQLRTEPGITITLKKIASEVKNYLRCTPEAEIAVAENDGVREYPGLRSVPGKDAFVLEPRGTGESRPCSMESDLNIILPSLYNTSALMLGDSLLAEKVRDILSALALLKKHGLKKACLRGAGNAAVPAAVAALFSPVPVELAVEKVPGSLKDYLTDWTRTMPPDLLIFGLLRHTDLPDLFRAAGAKGECGKPKKR